MDRSELIETIRDYAAAGHSDPWIAESVGLSRHTVYGIRVANNIPAGIQWPGGPYRKVSPKTIEAANRNNVTRSVKMAAEISAIHKELETETSLPAMAHRLGVQEDSLRSRLYKHGYGLGRWKKPTSRGGDKGRRGRQHLLLVEPVCPSNIPDHLRILYDLKYQQMLSDSEIAELLDIPEGTVKSRLSRLRQGAFSWMKTGNAGD